MKVLKEQFNHQIQLYLNDLHDYEDDENYIKLAESILNNLKNNILSEGLFDSEKFLNEHKSNLTKEHQNIISDFQMYINN